MKTPDRMTRRAALKRMGAAMVSAAIASAGVLPLAACGAKQRRRVVLYFTGTGNCLHVARELAGEGAELLSIPQLMKRKDIEIEADEIGIVYPVYGHMPPGMVRRFIKQAKLRAGYKFAVLTYGNRKCSAVEIWDGIARRAGHSFDYIGTLIMVDNWLPNFDMNEQMKIDKHIPENLGRIRADIDARKRWHEPVTELERQQHREFLERTGIDPERGFAVRSEDYFTVTDACVQCGICSAVCPCGNYKLAAGGAKAEGGCEFCFACIQNCPQHAIQFRPNEDDPLLRNGEKNPNARYRNEHISLMDIKRANNQF